MAVPANVRTITREEVEAQLERILSSKQVSSSASLSKLLSFLVRATLDGRAAELKEYVVGVEVFQRGEKFDPRIDSIVRVQSSKLRTRLQEYYEQAKDDPVFIDVPRGTYVPVWKSRETSVVAPGHSTSRRYQGQIIAVAVLTLFVAALLFYFARPAPDVVPTLAGPFRRLTTNAGLNTSPAISVDGEWVAYASDRRDGNLDIWVRQKSGEGAERQLTSGDADETEPTFSPDGKWVAFRSEEKDGGIYVISAEGGTPHLVAESGRRPRFSPDGKWIAYWVGREIEGHLLGARSGGMYIVPAVGGPPKQLRSEFLAARYPTWSPDGKHLLFVGVEMGSNPAPDWYVQDIAAETAARTGAAEAFARAGIQFPVGRLAPGEWLESGVLFSGGARDSANLWWIPLRQGSRWTTGDATRLTSGTDTQVQPVAGRRGPDGTIPIAIAVWSQNVDVWSFSEPRGVASRLTQDASRDQAGQLSPDGSTLAFLSDRSGATQLWIKDMQSGAERMATSTGHVVGQFHFSSDGQWIGFTTDETSRPLYRIPARRVASFERVCDQCGFVWHWSSDGRWIVHVEGLPARFRTFDRTTGTRADALYHSSYQLYVPRISRDGEWILFLARTGANRSRIAIARFRSGTPPAEADWVTVASDDTWNDKPAWADDGRAVYFTSDRDGFRCLWKQTIAPDSKRPSGLPRAVFHSHAARVSIGNAFDSLDLQVRGDMLVFEQGERDGSIWLSSLKLPPR